MIVLRYAFAFASPLSHAARALKQGGHPAVAGWPPLAVACCGERYAGQCAGVGVSGEASFAVSTSAIALSSAAVAASRSDCEDARLA